MAFFTWTRSRAAARDPSVPKPPTGPATRKAEEIPGADPLHDMDFIDLTLIEPHDQHGDMIHLGLCIDDRPGHVLDGSGATDGPWF